MWQNHDLKKNYDVVIIGGGAHGLATAYYLAEKSWHYQCCGIGTEIRRLRRFRTEHRHNIKILISLFITPS